MEIYEVNPTRNYQIIISEEELKAIMNLAQNTVKDSKLNSLHIYNKISEDIRLGLKHRFWSIKKF